MWRRVEGDLCRSSPSCRRGTSAGRDNKRGCLNLRLQLHLETPLVPLGHALLDDNQSLRSSTDSIGAATGRASGYPVGTSSASSLPGVEFDPSSSSSMATSSQQHPLRKSAHPKRLLSREWEIAPPAPRARPLLWRLEPHHSEISGGSGLNLHWCRVSRKLNLKKKKRTT